MIEGCPARGRQDPYIYSEIPASWPASMPASPISPMAYARIEDVHFNGGCLAARPPLTPAEVLASREGEAALTEAENRLLAEANALGPAALARLAGHKATRPVWRAIGLDAEGLDLAAGGHAARAQFAAPGHDPGAWRARLEALLGRAKL